MSQEILRQILMNAVDRLEVAATTGDIDCEETIEFVEGVRAMFDKNEDLDTPQEDSDYEPPAN